VQKRQADSILEQTISEPDDPAHEAWVSFLTAFHAVNRLRLRELYHAGFRKWHAGLLLLLHAREEGLTISEIAEIVCLANHSVTGMVNRAAKVGLVTKVDDPSDRRLVRIVITEKGRREYQRSLEHRQAIRRVMGTLSTEELEHFRRCLRIIRTQALAEESEAEAQGEALAVNRDSGA
jgi:DNA-binding MarR family transcriptional regulator